MSKETPIDTEQAHQAYYAQGETWADDRQQGLRRSRTIAWTVAAVAAAIALLEALALIALAPLKTVVPYTLLVDRQTGFAQVLKGGSADKIEADEALIQSMLAQYVIARESFDIASVRNDYRKVALWSADKARNDYLADMQSNNPASPFRRLPRTSIVATHIRSISALGRGTALVRFDTERLDQGQVNGVREPWVAIIRYRFTQAPMAIEDRLVNPLGFQVTHYRRDQEAPPVAAPTADGEATGPGTAQ